MRAPPETITLDDVVGALREAWSYDVESAESGLAFAVAPLRTDGGESLRPLDERHTIALFPFVHGTTAEWGELDAKDAAALVPLLADLHAAVVPVGVRIAGVELPGRAVIEQALREAHERWTGGPLTEAASAAFAENTDNVVAQLARLDELAAAVARDFVVTHGEPHAANVIRTNAGPVLVDWDTVALGPPERDLWMLFDDVESELARAYAHAAGRDPQQEALDLFRVSWDLKDLAEWLNVLRGPHTDNEDTRRQLDGLRHVVAAS